MKKILIYIFILILMCFSLPIIFTAEFSDRLQNTDSAALTNEITEAGNVSNTTEQKTESTYDYAKYSNIKLLHKDSEEIETIPLDEYLYGVVSAEMPASFEEEALKAQAVVARTYTIYKIVNSYFEISSQNIHTKEIEDVISKTEKTLVMINKSLDDQFTKMIQNDALDLDTEIDFLKSSIQMKDF